MNLKLEIEFSKADILKEVDALQKQINEMRPLPPDVEGRVMQKLRLDWNYNSNAIEGNKLDYGETVAFLMTGITAKGKPLKDHLDIRGHNEAILFLTSIVKEDRSFSESDIRALHEMILVEPYDVKAQTPDGNITSKRITLGKYKTLPNHVITATGEPHYYAAPEETEAKMQGLMEWYYDASANEEIHPVVTAALFHHRFVAIHPFDDGNGRLSRILMNLILMRSDFPPVIIRQDDKQNYYSLLSQADAGNDWPFIEYITERLQNSLKLYIKAAIGGDIDEDEDIDKEIALLKMQLKGGAVTKEKKTNEAVYSIFSYNILPLSFKILKKLNSFEEFFFTRKNWLGFIYSETKDGVLKESMKYDYLREDDTASYRDIMLNRSLDILRLFIEFNFEEYKNPNNTFNIKSELTVSFETHYYKIALNDVELMVKLYHEDISINEQSKVIKSIVQDFKQQLQEKLKTEA